MTVYLACYGLHNHRADVISVHKTSCSAYRACERYLDEYLHERSGRLTPPNDWVRDIAPEPYRISDPNSAWSLWVEAEDVRP